MVHHVESQTQMAWQFMIKKFSSHVQRELHYEITDIQEIMFGQKWTVTRQILVLVGHCILSFAPQEILC